MFVKKPERIEALVTVMSLALLVYSVAERYLKRAMKKSGKTLPNRDKKEIKKATLLWAFKLMVGLHLIEIEDTKKYICRIVGLNNVKKKIISLLPPPVKTMYEIAA